MAAIAGRNTVIAISTDGTTWATLGEAQSVSFNPSSDNLEVTGFGDTWRDRIQGIKDASWSVEMNYDPTDAQQIAIRDAFFNDTNIYIRSLFDGTNGFSQQCRVASFTVDTSVDGLTTVSAELEGAGTPTVVGA